MFRSQYFFAVISILFVLLSSCHIKSAIKGTLGLPVNTEQNNVLKNNIFTTGHTDTCVGTGIADLSIIHTVAKQASQDFSLVLVASIFIILVGFSFSADQPHPLYRSVKIPGSLSLFLQYRKLII